MNEEVNTLLGCSEYKKLKKHYVCTLVDERNGDIFYVAKGAGERVHHHGKEAGSSDAETEKLNKIREIEKSGYSVISRVIGRGQFTLLKS